MKEHQIVYVDLDKIDDIELLKWLDKRSTVGWEMIHFSEVSGRMIFNRRIEINQTLREQQLREDIEHGYRSGKTTEKVPG